MEHNQNDCHDHQRAIQIKLRNHSGPQSLKKLLVCREVILAFEDAL